MTEIFAIADPTYLPAMRVVTAITQANPAACTTSFAHDYGTGAVVRLLIPRGFGMPEINKRTGTITVTGDTTFTINIDSSQFTAFAVPAEVAGVAHQYASVVPIGEINSTFANSTENTL